jgi:hypothetical protein
MPNNNLLYFKDVSEEDYAFLKETKSHIWEQVKSKLYSEGVHSGEKELESYKPTLVYNSENQILAISIGKKGEKRNIFSSIDVHLMNDLEKRVFSATRNVLGECLEGIRLGEEEWEGE